ncbi:hypothetical protein EJ04DRAFT_507255 [Polyplosphaeria fusca]|uniref:Uncharacterized protein n=1 Tax=Polyplosphaeria fusca TaxID=682080 RepID=A0A9P4RDZ3_9PLEO|nr:hypothetical protein EJ04DRAFT_507255 [Polyplosphaeria fusca]
MDRDLQPLFAGLNLDVMRLPPYMPGGAAPSPFFTLPAELRLQIYELVFTPFHPLDFPLPPSFLRLLPLLTCRQFYQEARLLAFACVVHTLDCTRITNVRDRLRSMHPALAASIRHIYVHTSITSFYDKMQPLRYHFDHTRDPHISLDTLTIMFNRPEEDQFSRLYCVQNQDMVLDAIWYYKNVKKVILWNIRFRENLSRNMPGSWFRVDEGSESSGPLWRLEMTQFADYSWPPWRHHQVAQAGEPKRWL